MRSKSIALFVFCLLVFIGCASTKVAHEDDLENGETETAAKEAAEAADTAVAWKHEGEEPVVYPEDDTAWEGEELEEEPEKEKKPFYVKDRAFEMGFINFNIGASNNFLSTYGFFKEKAIIDIDKLNKGFKVNVGFELSPVFFSYNKNNKWGFGFYTGIDATGILGLSGEMLTFKETKNSPSDVGGAVFAEAGIPVFFHIEDFKVKIRTALYYPIAYITSDIKYTFENRTTDGLAETIFYIKYQIDAYTALPLNFENGISFNPSARPGVDFHLGAEYPLSDKLNLTDVYPFLDFDVGLDIINLPMVPSSMSDYMRLKGRVGNEEPLGFLNDFLGGNTDEEEYTEEESGSLLDNFLSIEEAEYGSVRKAVFRPFKMLAWAEWQPFEDKRVTFIPTLGFAITPYYNRPGSFEGSIKSRLNLRNLFIITLGTGYHDRLFKNSLDMILNFRIAEFGLGLSMESPSFLRSWSGGGFGIKLGARYGY
jgi:hypothetical protein